MPAIKRKATEHPKSVARLGSVTEFAKALQVSSSAVSQQISQLEVKHFYRAKWCLLLTVDGDHLSQTTTQSARGMQIIIETECYMHFNSEKPQASDTVDPPDWH